MSDRVLVVLPVSPWSERARWSLDHHGLAYKTVEHAPFLGERRLRRLVGPGAAKATVPVLVDGDTKFTESVDIARHADRLGAGAKLFPAGADDDIARWCSVADAGMAGGRALVSRGMLANSEALDEALPPEVPGFVRPVARPVTRYATRWFARKYGLDLDDVAGAEAKVRRALDALRAGLAGGREYLRDGFSYADIAMATLLQGVRPVEHARYPFGPATRRVWTHEALAAEYGDLIAWRDEVYRRHRG